MSRRSAYERYLAGARAIGLRIREVVKDEDGNPALFRVEGPGPKQHSERCTTFAWRDPPMFTCTCPHVHKNRLRGHVKLGYEKRLVQPCGAGESIPLGKWRPMSRESIYEKPAKCPCVRALYCSHQQD